MPAAHIASTSLQQGVDGPRSDSAVGRLLDPGNRRTADVLKALVLFATFSAPIAAQGLRNYYPADIGMQLRHQAQSWEGAVPGSQLIGLLGEAGPHETGPTGLRARLGETLVAVTAPTHTDLAWVQMRDSNNLDAGMFTLSHLSSNAHISPYALPAHGLIFSDPEFLIAANQHIVTVLAPTDFRDEGVPPLMTQLPYSAWALHLTVPTTPDLIGSYYSLQGVNLRLIDPDVAEMVPTPTYLTWSDEIVFEIAA